MTRVAAWLLVAMAVVGLVVDTALTAAQGSLLAPAVWYDHGWPLIPLTTLGAAVMGALIVSRSSRHPIGWLLLVASLTSIASPAEAYSLWVLDGGGGGPQTAGHAAAWVSRMFNAPLGITAMALVYLLAPDGRLRSSRWRWVAWSAVIGLVLYLISTLLVDPTTYEVGARAGTAAGLLEGVGSLIVIAALVGSAVSLYLRVRHARGEARRQLLWIAASAVLVAAGLVVVGTAAFVGVGRPVASVALFAAYLTMPLAVAVAVLRHRLFDIDVIVNRALVVLLLTAFVAAAYVLVVVAFGQALSPGGGSWASLLTTAVVALAVEPLRRRVVQLADRLAYGASAVPYEALADFSRRLGASPYPATLLPAVADAAARAVGARRATVRLAVVDDADRVSTWPPGGTTTGGPVVSVPVTEAGEVLGRIEVAMPEGRPARSSDLALMRDLAGSAAVAFRNARLSDDLAVQVDELGRRTDALEGSRRRLLDAGDQERLRLQRSLARDVLPRLEGLVTQLDARATAGGSVAGAGTVDPLISSTNSALDALRTITRGVYPAQLVRSGLEPALRSLLSRSEVGRLDVRGPSAGQRFAASVEAAAYFCVADAVQELVPPVVVTVEAADAHLRLLVVGGHRDGLALAGMRDRVEAEDGSFASRTTDGVTRLDVALPLRPGSDLPRQAPSGRDLAADHAAASVSGAKSDFVR